MPKTLMKVRKTIDIEVENLGEAIREARKLDKRSLADICKLVNMTPSNWSRIEKEQTKALPLETLRKIEEVLNVDFGVKFND